MAGSRKRRRRRRRRARWDYRKIAIFLLFCLLVLFTFVTMISAFFSHKKEYFNEGLDYYEAEEYDKALDKFEAALDEKQLFTKRRDMNIQLYIADIYMKTGEYLKAVEEYDEVLEYSSVNEDEVLEMQALAQALYNFNQGNYAGALPVLEQAAQKDYPEMYLYVGTCYGQIDDVNNMLKSYETYVKEFGYNSYIYAQYASYYMSIGELEQAYGYINNGLSSDSEYNAALRLLEIAYYEENKDFEQAYALAEEFISLYPDNEEGEKEYTFLYTRVTHE